MAYSSRETANVAPYLVGNRVYGGGRPFPTMGPVDRMGYRERDLKASARRDAVLRRLKANNRQDYANPDALRTV